MIINIKISTYFFDNIQQFRTETLKIFDHRLFHLLKATINEIALVGFLVVKTDGYSAEGSGFKYDIGRCKCQYIRRVSLPSNTLLLVTIPEFKLKLVLFGSCYLLWPWYQSTDIYRWFVCSHRVSRWFYLITLTSSNLNSVLNP